MRAITVLGANGFVGSRVTDAAARAGLRVVAIDRFSVRPSFGTTPSVQIVNSRNLSRIDFQRAVAGHVIDCLPDSNPLESQQVSPKVFEHLYREKLNLLELVFASDALGYTFLSSGGTIYGETQSKGAREDSALMPSTPYSLNKVRIEQFLKETDTGRLKIQIARLSTLYGLRRQQVASQGLIHNAIMAAHTGKPLRVYGDGSMVRDYLYVEDAAEELVHLSLSSPILRVTNLGSGTSNSINSVISIVQEILGASIKIRQVQVPPGFLHTATLDISKLRGESANFSPLSLREGISRMNDILLNAQARTGICRSRSRRI